MQQEVSTTTSQHPIEHEAAARAKPLNANTRAALPTGLRVWNDEIEYLDSAIATSPAHLKAHFTKKRDDLIRAREWLASIIETRGADDHGR